MLKTITHMILIILGIYLLFAFVIAELNPFLWKESTRFIFVWLDLTAIGWYIIYKSNKNGR